MNEAKTYILVDIFRLVDYRQLTTYSYEDFEHYPENIIHISMENCYATCTNTKNFHGVSRHMFLRLIYFNLSTQYTSPKILQINRAYFSHKICTLL